MSRPKDETPNQLIADVRDVLKATEPRPAALPAPDSIYGFKRVTCPTCGTMQRPESYNHHWTYYHGVKFWKEKALIELITEATK